MYKEQTNTRVTFVPMTTFCHFQESEHVQDYSSFENSWMARELIDKARN